jgi:UPF0716 protein FxsA
MPFLFLALVAVPIIEIALFIEIGGIIGTWATIGAIVLTAAAGAVLLRAQGGGLLARARTTLGRGEMPVEEVIHGLFLLIAGVLLMTPGFFTDALGLLLCVPPLRLALGRAILRRVRGHMQMHVARFSSGPPPRSVNDPPGARRPPDTGPDNPPPPRVPGGRSRWQPPQGHRDDERDRS